MMTKPAVLFASVLMLAACGNEVKLNVDKQSAIAEFPADSVLSLLSSDYCYIVDSNGDEVPSQITYDGKLIFSCESGSGVFTALPSDSLHNYKASVSGRIYPERADDIAWENELNGYRMYGPATRNKGEKAFGYDIFFKHKSREQVLEEMYRRQTDGRLWRKVDSLRQVSEELASKMADSISYHIDHGKGMDCYAVGSTLGAGASALFIADSLAFSWCYEMAEILDNGPLRFTVRLDMVPREIAGNKNVVEHRLISLDAGSYLNDCMVWFDGFDSAVNVATGFPLRDATKPLTGLNPAILAYSDPTQGQDNGRALLGIRLYYEPDSIVTRQDHILAVKQLQATDTLKYKWGFAWDRENFNTLENWTGYLKSIK